MKVVFDTNVYVAEALLGAAASQMVQATHSAGWRTYVSAYLLDELERVLADNLGFPRRLASSHAIASSAAPSMSSFRLPVTLFRTIRMTAPFCRLRSPRVRITW